MGIDIKAQENGNTDYIGAVHRSFSSVFQVKL